MKVIIASPSPYARKVRVILREKKIKFEEIIDIPWNSDTLTNNFNPLGKIPILIRDGHEPLFDSRVISQYLDFYKPQPLFYPKNSEENISARLIETIADGICDAVVLLFLENSRQKNLRSKNWIKRQEKKIFSSVEYLSTYLEGKNHFVGDHFNIADVSGFSCLEYIDLRYPQLKWKEQYPNLKEYWETHKDRQSFKETIPITQIIEPLED